MVVVARPLGEFGEEPREIRRRQIGKLVEQSLETVEVLRRQSGEVIEIEAPGLAAVGAITALG